MPDGLSWHALLSFMRFSPARQFLIFGLVIGKQIGITCFAWVAVGLASLMEGVSWKHLYATSWFGRIAFTMSIFIATLAFQEPQVLSMIKIAVLTVSVIAGFVGWLILTHLSQSDTNSS